MAFSGSTASWSRMQYQLLHPPVRQLAHEDLARIAAIDLMHCAQFLDQLAGLTELAQDAPVEFHFVDLTVVHGSAGIGIGSIQIRMGSPRNANRVRRADAGVLRFEVSI